MTAAALDAPPAFLQLVGHPLRWQLLRELAGSDRTVQELTVLVGQPQNLVSYHLGKLRHGRLVIGRRSAADGRDTYYRVALGRLGESLAAAGGALHPALRLVPPPADVTAAAGPPARVLFLCTGNSARSPMAEGFARVRSGGRVEAHSAGSHPKPLHPTAVRVMRDDYGIDLGAHRPKHLDEFADERFDRVVTLCDRVREVCPEFPGAAGTAHWSMADPSAEPDPEAAFRQAAAELDDRVAFLLADLTTPTG